MARLLIVDDQGWVHQRCTEGLAGEGHRLEAGPDPPALPQCIRLLNPDGVILNLNLKRDCGWYVLVHLKIQFPKLPILTVLSDDADFCDPRIHLCEDCLEGDFSPALLKQKVRKLLSRPLPAGPAPSRRGPAKGLPGLPRSGASRAAAAGRSA